MLINIRNIKLLIYFFLYVSLNSVTLAASKLNPPKLIWPGDNSIINTQVPSFSWKSLATEGVEYRIKIAEVNGKIILDQWLGSDTLFVISSTNALKDSKVYRWSVIAYSDQSSDQSQVNSFCIDLNVILDLQVSNIRLLTTQDSFQAGDNIAIEATILNCGPEICYSAKAYLYNGNANANFFKLNVIRKSLLVDSIDIKPLKPTKTEKVVFNATLQHGLNNYYVEVRPSKKYFDVITNNNLMTGFSIQTIPEKLQIRGLFLIYSTYTNGILTASDRQAIYQTIEKIKNFFWDHTQILDLQIDTLRLDHKLTDENFDYIDANWGYVLSPATVDQDLFRLMIQKANYDLIFAFYNWQNSPKFWTGYNGYSFAPDSKELSKIAYAAQPITPESINDEKIGIHEILHLIEQLYDKKTELKFLSPDNKQLLTTFTDELNYYAWILESWPSENWFKMPIGKKITSIRLSPETTQSLPQELALLQNYPNPFNSTTKISYDLPLTAPGSNSFHVTLKIYSILGELVATLIDEAQKPGIYSVTWHGIDQQGYPVPSGIYFYMLSANEQTIVKKLLCIK